MSHRRRNPQKTDPALKWLLLLGVGLGFVWWLHDAMQEQPPPPQVFPPPQVPVYDR